MTYKQTAPAATGAASVNLAGARQTKNITRTEAASRGRAVILNGSACGYILGDTFERLFNRHIHLYRRGGNALCLHVELIERLKREGIGNICAIDEDGVRYWLTLAELQRFGRPVNDLHHGRQIGVPIRYWRPTKESATPAESEWSQGTLL